MVSVLLDYARVSTAEQDADLQTDELKSAGVLTALRGAVGGPPRRTR